jgi:serine/threonine protein kinase
MQNGGKVLGKGGYGCVISPPLKCKTRFNKVPYSIDDKYISKIVEYVEEEDDEIMNEFKLGSKLLKIDPMQKYFSPIINGCKFYKQPSKDMEYESYRPFLDEDEDEYEEYNDSENKHIQRERKCKIYKNEEYLNLISKNAGITLDDVFENKNEEIVQYFKENYVTIFKHLCYSVYILHKNNILHTDIKIENTMINYNSDRKKASITIIDFGLSEELKPTYSSSSLYYVTYYGTEFYKPIEICMINYILELIKKNNLHQLSKNNLQKKVIKKILNEYSEIYDEYLNNYFFSETGLVFNNNKLNKNTDFLSENKYGNKNTLKIIFERIYQDLDDNTLTDKLINNQKNILKWDVFSLGLIFAKILIECDIQDIKAFKLVNKMITPFYWKRYNIKDCLEDSFFKSITKKTSTKKQEQKNKHKTIKHKTIKHKNKN